MTNAWQNTDTYRLCHDFPDNRLKCLLIDLLVSHQRQLKSIRKRLYYFLQPQTKHRIPQFYLSIEGVHARKEEPCQDIIMHLCSAFMGPEIPYFIVGTALSGVIFFLQALAWI